jgi:uncharacterized protein
MDNLHKFKVSLRKGILDLSNERRIRFGLDICKRLLPEYKVFKEKFNYGNVDILDDSLRFCELNINSNYLDIKKLDELFKQVESVIPDTESFSCIEVSFALNASVSVAELLAYYKDKDIEHLMTISEMMTDTIDFKIIELNNDVVDERLIDNHPLLINEFNYQLKMTE